MAIGAVRGIWQTIIMRLSVTAFKIHIKDFGMTGGAVHWLIGGAGTLQMVGNLGMALGTLDVLVY
jgi:hypothetical protein